MNVQSLRRAVARQPTLRAVAGTVVDRLVAVVPGAPPGLRGAPAGVPAGDVVTVLVVVLGADVDTLRTSLDDLAEVARRHGHLRLVVAVDGEHLAVVRRAGVLAEHLVDRASWERRRDGQEWTAYLQAKLATVRHDLGAQQVVVLPSSGTTGMDRDLLLASLPGPPTGRLLRWWRRSVLRIETALDQPTG